MLLYLFIVFLVLSLIIVTLGLFRTEHSELALVGFFFLFLLSFVVIAGDIQYKVGENFTYSCLCCVNGLVVGNDTQFPCTENATLQVSATNDVYETWSGGGTLSHLVGYWLAVMSMVGFVGVILGIRRPQW